MVNLRERGEGELDDIDHLGNRRVRLVGELLNNQIYVGLLRIERIVRERFRIQETHGALMPQDFLNVKPLNAVFANSLAQGSYHNLWIRPTLFQKLPIKGVYLLSGLAV